MIRYIIIFCFFNAYAVHGALDFLKDFSEEHTPVIIQGYDHKKEDDKANLIPSVVLGNSKLIITEYAVREEIIKQLKLKYALSGDLKIFLNKAFQDLPIKSETWELEIIRCPADKLTENFLITFCISSNGTLLGQWQLPIRAEIWEDAYISIKYIRKGSELSKADFKIHPVDVLRVKGKSVGVFEDLSDYSANQNVPKDDVLIYQDLKRKPDILKGQIVDVIAIEGGIKVVLKAKALDDGLKGEYILVQNLQSKKNIQGQVLDDKLVRVYF